MSRTLNEQELERFREDLRLIAMLDLDVALQGKLDLSGVLQITLLEAHQGLKSFRGTTDAELLGWMRRILANNLMDEIRKIQRVGYDARLDVSIHQSSSRLSDVLMGEHTPPDVRAERNEELLKLTRAMLKLPEDQRYAVLRHHMHDASVAVVAEEMGRTQKAVAGLIHRGISHLRKEMMP